MRPTRPDGRRRRCSGRPRRKWRSGCRRRRAVGSRPAWHDCQVQLVPPGCGRVWRWPATLSGPEHRPLRRRRCDAHWRPRERLPDPGICGSLRSLAPRFSVCTAGARARTGAPVARCSCGQAAGMVEVLVREQDVAHVLGLEAERADVGHDCPPALRGGAVDQDVALRRGHQHRADAAGADVPGIAVDAPRRGGIVPAGVGGAGRWTRRRAVRRRRGASWNQHRRWRQQEGKQEVRGDKDFFLQVAISS